MRIPPAYFAIKFGHPLPEFAKRWAPWLRTRPCLGEFIHVRQIELEALWLCNEAEINRRGQFEELFRTCPEVVQTVRSALRALDLKRLLNDDDITLEAGVPGYDEACEIHKHESTEVESSIDSFGSDYSNVRSKSGRSKLSDLCFEDALFRARCLQLHDAQNGTNEFSELYDLIRFLAANKTVAAEMDATVEKLYEDGVVKGHIIPREDYRKRYEQMEMAYYLLRERPQECCSCCLGAELLRFYRFIQ
ncbi:hypothetical protein GGR57DRAFT_467504 [Xylariaceae sp. FL1272]|nr:hypothetical protein GGR57DRAFT_467504 [Xylariaceae sp. FL1272]